MRRIPEDVHAAACFRNVEQLYELGTWGWNALSKAPGASLVTTRLRKIAAELPIPAPWSAAELWGWGLPAQGTLGALWLERKHGLVGAVMIAEPRTFKRKLKRLKGLTSSSHRGRELLSLTSTTGERVFCRLDSTLLFCAEDPDRAARGADKLQKGSLWASLGESQKEIVRTSEAWGTVNLYAHEASVGLKVETDGVSFRSRISGPMLRNLQGKAGMPRRLARYLRGRQTAIYFRLPRPLLATFAATSPHVRPAVASLMRRGLTGEAVLVSGENGPFGALIGTTGREASLKLFNLAAGRLFAAKRRHPPSKPASGDTGLQMKRFEQQNELPALRITYEPNLKTSSEPLDLLLAASPKAVVLTTEDSVRAVLRNRMSRKKARLSSRHTTEEQMGLGEGGVVSGRSPLGDPLHPLAGFLRPHVESLPPRAKKSFHLLRFLLDQLHSHSLGARLLPPDTIEIAYRIRTLHRENRTDDDKARPMWHRFLNETYQGKGDEAKETYREIKESFPKTRYSKLDDRIDPGLAAGTAKTAILAAIFVPAFVRYLRRSRAAQARANIRRLALAAQAASLEERVSEDGEARKGGFPLGDTGWAPKEPCCKQPGGTCRPNGPDTTNGYSPIWKKLGGLPRHSSPYQYRYVGTSDTSSVGFTVQARGDLDCDSTFSLYTIEGRLKNGKVVLGEINVQNPLE
jgi:hypothetical protein